MIYFSRDGKKIIIRIEHGIFKNSEGFNLELYQSYDYQAELLKRAFGENLKEKLLSIKKKYYDEGWKHAKARTAKREHFNGYWE